MKHNIGIMGAMAMSLSIIGNAYDKEAVAVKKYSNEIYPLPSSGIRGGHQPLYRNIKRNQRIAAKKRSVKRHKALARETK